MVTRENLIAADSAHVDAFLTEFSLRIMGSFPDLAAGIAQGRAAGLTEKFLVDLYAVDAARILEHVVVRASSWRPRRRREVHRALRLVDRSNILPLTEALLNADQYMYAYRTAWCYRNVNLSENGKHKYNLMLRINDLLGKQQQAVPLGTLLYILENRAALGNAARGAQVTPQLLRAADLCVAQIRQLVRG